MQVSHSHQPLAFKDGARLWRHPHAPEALVARARAGSPVGGGDVVARARGQRQDRELFPAPPLEQELMECSKQQAHGKEQPHENQEERRGFSGRGHPESCQPGAPGVVQGLQPEVFRLLLTTSGYPSVFPTVHQRRR